MSCDRLFYCELKLSRQVVSPPWAIRADSFFPLSPPGEDISFPTPPFSFFFSGGNELDRPVSPLPATLSSTKMKRKSPPCSIHSNGTSLFPPTSALRIASPPLFPLQGRMGFNVLVGCFLRINSTPRRLPSFSLQTCFPFPNSLLPPPQKVKEIRPRCVPLPQ